MAGKAFHSERWADMFLAVVSDAGEDADTVFLCLKAFVAPVKSVHGVFFGHRAAAKLEEALRESAAISEAADGKIPTAVEYAIRFICLLVEKQYFKYIDLLLQRIEQKIDKQKGILSFTVEAASPVDSGFEDEIKRMIKEKTGAAGVKIKTCVKPELLGGYLLRTDKFYIDASLKGQVENMKLNLLGGANG